MKELPLLLSIRRSFLPNNVIPPSSPDRVANNIGHSALAVRSQSLTICSNFSVVVPACDAIRSWIKPFSPLTATTSRSFSSTALKGC